MNVPPSSVHPMRRSISNDANNFPLHMISIQSSVQPSNKRMRALPDPKYTPITCFTPETVESTTELCDLYRQVWREHVYPLITDRDSCLSFRGTKRRLSRSDDTFYYDQGRDDHGMRIVSMANVDALFSKMNPVTVPLRRIGAQPELRGTVMSATEIDPIVIDSDDDSIQEEDEESLACTVETLYSFDLEFAENTDDR